MSQTPAQFTSVHFFICFSKRKNDTNCQRYHDTVGSLIVQCCLEYDVEHRRIPKSFFVNIVYCNMERSRADLQLAMAKYYLFCDTLQYSPSSLSRRNSSNSRSSFSFRNLAIFTLGQHSRSFCVGYCCLLWINQFHICSLTTDWLTFFVGKDVRSELNSSGGYIVSDAQLQWLKVNKNLLSLNVFFLYHFSRW
jgi:hypothetical protein